MGQEWYSLLSRCFETESFRKLSEFLSAERKHHTVYPPEEMVFNAFSLTSPAETRAVILGQDPYHGEGQAHGLAFSVPEGIAPPPSLKNIFRELRSGLGTEISGSGNLEPWARQGVLLLNTVMTVRAGHAGSHRGMGWEEFTDCVIKSLSNMSEPVVFILWGGDAHRKERLIDSSKNLVLKGAHPSPLSAYRGFFGTGHFSRANEFLMDRGRGEIDWRI